MSTCPRKTISACLVAILCIPFSAATAPQKVPLRIVHLGDSFSSGSGARNAGGQQDYHLVSGCYRSQSNWGQIFADSLADDYHVTYINRACSGSVLADIVEERELSIMDKNAGVCPTSEFPSEEVIRDTTADSCTRFLKAQVEAVDDSVDLVLLTIGRNNVQLDKIVKQCFVLGEHCAGDCQDAVNSTSSYLDTTFQEQLVLTLEQICTRLKPEARVVLVSYPHLILSDVTYHLEDASGFIYDAGASIRAIATRVDEIQKAAVQEVNDISSDGKCIVYFNQTKELFATHEPDPSVLRNNTFRWINEAFEGSLKEWYHPNRRGHVNLGNALSVDGTFGAVGGALVKSANIDLVFVVDTTGSMSGEIAEVRQNLEMLVNQLQTSTNSHRVAVVSYRDFPSRTISSDYPSRVDQSFTSNLTLIQAGIDSLVASGGGDFAESVFSGIKEAIDLPWRSGVTQVAVVIGDAVPLVVDGAEPVSNLTVAQIIAESLAGDPMQIVGVDVGRLTSPEFRKVVDGTGGRLITSVSNLTSALSDIIAVASEQPLVWIGEEIVGKVGVPVVFDARGSYDPQGLELTKYEWDFDGDGIFDIESSGVVNFTYDDPFDGTVVLRVVNSNNVSGLGSVRTVVNDEGSTWQGEEPCNLEQNYSVILDEATGIFHNCDANSLPTMDKAGCGEAVVDPAKSSKKGATKSSKSTRSSRSPKKRGLRHKM